jgi:hypothetical protein
MARFVATVLIELVGEGRELPEAEHDRDSDSGTEQHVGE